MSDIVTFPPEGLIVERCVVVRPTGALALRALVIDGANLSLQAFHGGHCIGAARFLPSPISYGRRLAAVQAPVVLATLTGTVPNWQDGQPIELRLQSGSSLHSLTLLPEAEDAREGDILQQKISLLAKLALADARLAQGTLQPGQLSSLTNAMVNGGLEREAENFLRRAILTVEPGETPLEYAVAVDHLAFLYSSRQPASLAVSLCDELARSEHERHGQTSWGYMAEAVARCIAGQSAVADALFEKAAAMADKMLFHNSVGVFNRRPVDFTTKLDNQPRPEILSWMPAWRTDLAVQATADDIIHLFSCDSGYFKKYGLALIQNSHGVGGSPLIHCHLVAPDEEDLRQITQLRAHNPGLRLNMSYEDNDVTEGLPFGSRERSGYLICPRYLRAPDVFALYDRPILITEADCRLALPWNEIKEMLAQVEVGVNFNPAERFPWRRIGAQIAYYNNSPTGRHFADLVSKYIGKAFDRQKHNNWLIDQNALWAAYEVMGEKTAGIQFFRSLPANIIELAQNFQGGKEAFAQMMKTQHGAGQETTKI